VTWLATYATRAEILKCYNIGPHVFSDDTAHSEPLPFSELAETWVQASNPYLTRVLGWKCRGPSIRLVTWQKGTVKGSFKDCFSYELHLTIVLRWKCRGPSIRLVTWQKGIVKGSLKDCFSYELHLTIVLGWKCRGPSIRLVTWQKGTVKGSLKDCFSYELHLTIVLESTWGFICFLRRYSHL